MKKIIRVLSVLFAIMFLMTACTPKVENNTGSDTSKMDTGKVKNDPNKIVWVVSDSIYTYIQDNKEAKQELSNILKENGIDKEVVFDVLKFKNQRNLLRSVDEVVEAINERNEAGLQTDIISPPPFKSHQSNTINLNLYYGLYKAGVYAPIDEYINNDKELKDMYVPTFWDSLTIDGKIYAIRNLYSSEWTAPALWINKTMCDECGIKVSDIENKKFYEMENIVKQVYEQQIKQDENTKINGIIELFPKSMYTYLPFEYITKNVGVLKDQKELKAVNIFKEKETKENLKVINNYVKQKIISDKDKEEPVRRFVDVADYYIPQMRCGYYDVDDNNKRVNITLQHTYIDMDYKYKNDEYVIKYNELDEEHNATNAVTGITAWSKNKDDAFKLISLVSKKSEIANLILYGIKDKDYVMQDGYPMRQRPDGELEMIAANNGGIPCSLSKYPIKNNEPVDIAELYKKYAPGVKKAELLGFWFNYDNVKNEVIATDEIFNKYQFLWTGVLSGNDKQQYFPNSDPTVDFEKTYKEMLDELDKAGIDKIIDEANKQLAAWKK